MKTKLVVGISRGNAASLLKLLQAKSENRQGIQHFLSRNSLEKFLLEELKSADAEVVFTFNATCTMQAVEKVVEAVKKELKIMKKQLIFS